MPHRPVGRRGHTPQITPARRSRYRFVQKYPDSSKFFPMLGARAASPHLEVLPLGKRSSTLKDPIAAEREPQRKTPGLSTLRCPARW